MPAAANYKEIIDYICTGTGLCLECSGDFAPGFLIIQIVLLLIGSGLSIFDTITDWNIVIQFRDHGFQNPLLPIDINWLRAWYLFAVIGTILTAITVFHETLDVLHSMWHTCKRCCCKSGKHYRVLKEKEEGNVVEMPNKTKGSNTTQEKQTAESQKDESEGTDRDHRDHQYHLYQDGSNENLNTGDKDENKKDTDDSNDHTEKGAQGTGTTAQTENKDANSEDDDETIDNACKCCYRYGWNFTTRAETLSFLSLWFHNVPMLTMAVLYAFSQSTCKLPVREDVTDELLNVGISATASTIAASYRLTRSFVRLFISVGVRIKSKKEASKMGKWGKCCSRLLPKVGDAIYPKNTCAEWCIVPYYASLLFDFSLVSMGASIAFSIWINYLLLKQGTNFDDSLGIYRFQTDGSYTFVTNISGTIIPSSGSDSANPYVVLETIQDRGHTTYCLSEFQYIEKDSEIIFDTVELQPMSDNGVFCAVKSGYNSQHSGNFSSCTVYYGSPDLKILHYAFSDPTTGETKLLENECTVLKDRIPSVNAGPRFDIDLEAQVEKKIDRTNHPDATQDLRILFVGIQNSTARPVLLDFSVADIVAGGLDKTYLRTFQDPCNGTNTTYLIRFVYDNFTNQFTYNVRGIYNYSPPSNGTCTCGPILDVNTFRQFVKMGRFVYGYFDPLTGFHQFLQNCSIIPFDKLIPWYNFLHFVACSSWCDTIE